MPRRPQEKEEELSSSYSVKLEIFEGPLDLLLFLIRQNEVDIYDIPISLITQQYLEYIQLMEVLELDLAGEFILMAATLLRIKAKMLLPKTRDEEQEEEDPREELIWALLEYKKYKQAAKVLEERQETEGKYFKRSDFSHIDLPLDKDLAKDITFFDLLSAFRRVMKETPQESLHRLKTEKITVEERIQYIMGYLEKKSGATFEELFLDNPVRLVLIVTFIAILELVRSRKIRVMQSDNFAQIRVYPNHG